MIYNIPNIIPTNTSYTREAMVTALRSMLNDYGGQQLDTYELRLWLNMGLTRAASFVRTFAPRLYTVRWQASLGNEDYWGLDVNYGITQVPYRVINLSLPVQTNSPDYSRNEIMWPERITPGGVFNDVAPFNYISDILSLQILHRYNGGYPTYWSGLPHRLEIDAFTGVVAGLNDQWRQDIVWTMQGHKILVWFGSEVLQSPGLGDSRIPTNWYADALVELTVLRKPILDDLRSLDDTAYTSNYKEFVDCPDEAIPLVLQYAREIAIGVMNKPDDPTAKQNTALVEQSLLTSFGHATQAPAQ